MRRPRVGPLVGLFDVICVEKVPRRSRNVRGLTMRTPSYWPIPADADRPCLDGSGKVLVVIEGVVSPRTFLDHFDSSTLVGSESRNKTVHLYAAWRQTHDGTRKIWHKFDRQSSIGYHLRLRFSRSHADSGQDSIRAPSGDGPKHNRYVITDWSSKTRGVRQFLEGLSSTRRQGDTYSGGDVAETRALLRER